MEKHKAFCSLPFTKLLVDGDGLASQCCYQLTKLGSVLETPVLEIWNNHISKQVRQTITEGELHPVCTSWNTCPFQSSEKYVYEFDVHQNFEYPNFLEICLPNTHCNIGGENPSDENPACIMCVRNFDFKRQPPITDLLCEKVKPLMPYLKYLCVLGVAEPFWKDAVFRVFEKLEFSKYKDKITFTTNTNGICFVERTIKRFFQEVEFSDLSISLDAATPETYLKIRRVDGYEMILKNLKIYMELRDTNGGSGRHNIVIYNNINLINVHEMTGMVEAAYELGIGKMIMLPTHDQCGMVNMGELLLNEKNVKVFKKASEMASKRAERLGVDLHYSKSFDTVPPPIQASQLVQLQLPTQ